MLLVGIDEHCLINDMLAEMIYVNEFALFIITYNAEMMAASGLVILTLKRW